MSYLFDTNILLWAVNEPRKLAPEAARLVDDPASDRVYSVTSLWETAIKSGRGRPDFDADAALLRHALLDGGCREIVINAEHALAVRTLPPLHRDPFDRMLVAQALVEGLTLVTADRALARYPARVMVV
jgi:PIN domain nuclease of toxin-antitoxin system